MLSKVSKQAGIWYYGKCQNGILEKNTKEHHNLYQQVNLTTAGSGGWCGGGHLYPCTLLYHLEEIWSVAWTFQLAAALSWRVLLSPQARVCGVNIPPLSGEQWISAAYMQNWDSVPRMPSPSHYLSLTSSCWEIVQNCFDSSLFSRSWVVIIVSLCC